MTEIPKSLKNDPIIDCVIELRFNPSSESVSDLLPGLLYNSFKDQYPNTVQTPEAQLPRVVRASDKNLKSRPVVKFEGAEGSIGIGDAGIQLIFSRPYPGWDVVRPRAESLFGQTLETGLLESVERLSIRYNNIITINDDVFDLSPLELEFKIGRGLELRGPGTALRAEVSIDSTTTIIEVQAGAKAVISPPDQPPEELHGVLLAVDTVSFGNIEDLKQLEERLMLIHEVEKNIFFRTITEDTRDKLDPEWG